MKDDVFDLEALEELMLRKSYADLSEEELRMVSAHVGSESEYNDLRDTLMNVRKTFREEKVTLRPRVDMKEALLKKFEEVHGKGGGNVKMDNRPRRFHIPVFYRYAGAAAVLLVAFMLVLNQYRSEKTKQEEQPIAMQKEKNITTAPAPEKTGEAPPPPSDITRAPVVTEETGDGQVTTITATETLKDESISQEYTYTTGETNNLTAPAEGEGYFSSAREEGKEDKKVTLDNADLLLAKEDAPGTTGVSTNMYENYGFFTESQKLNTTKKERGNNGRNNTTSPGVVTSNSSISYNGNTTQGGVNLDLTTNGSGDDNTTRYKDGDGLKNANVKTQIRRSLIYSDL